MLFRKVINGAIKVSNAVGNISNGLSELSNELEKVGITAQEKVEIVTKIKGFGAEKCIFINTR